jgi:hypothetical protein
MRSKGLLVLLEHFRRNRQDYRTGWNYAFTFGRRRPLMRELPIVPVDPPVMDGYGSRYPSPRLAYDGPRTTITLDRI